MHREVVFEKNGGSRLDKQTQNKKKKEGEEPSTSKKVLGREDKEKKGEAYSPAAQDKKGRKPYYLRGGNTISPEGYKKIQETIKFFSSV